MKRQTKNRISAVVLLSVFCIVLSLIQRHLRVLEATRNLFPAVNSGHVQAVKRLLDQGADPNTYEHLPALPRNLGAFLRTMANKTPYRGDGERPLNCAVSQGRVDLVLELLSYGARPSERNADYWQDNALTTAVIVGHKDCLRVLLAHKADPDSPRGNDGVTALMLAAFFHRDEMVQMLLDHGAKLDRKDHSGQTPLHCACVGWRAGPALRPMQLFLDGGADVNAATHHGDTPLLLVMGWNSLPAVKLLLQHGANPNVRNAKGESPLQIAASLPDAGIPRLLKRYGAKEQW